MDADHHLASVAAAIADPVRARILCALLDGRSRTATELAAVGGVTPSTTSVHLHKLEAARLVRCVPAGKHRYYQIAGPEAGAAVEALLRVSARKLPPFRSPAPIHLRFARTCYDHAAGELAVALHDQFLARGWLEEENGSYRLTQSGSAEMRRIGMADPPTGSRRRFAYPCLDWSERRFHLGGWLGSAWLDLAEKKNWLVRDPGSRALELTPSGRRHLAGWGLGPMRSRP